MENYSRRVDEIILIIYWKSLYNIFNNKINFSWKCYLLHLFTIFYRLCIHSIRSFIHEIDLHFFYIIRYIDLYFFYINFNSYINIYLFILILLFLFFFFICIILLYQSIVHFLFSSFNIFSTLIKSVYNFP